MKIKLPVKLIFKNRKLKLKCVNKGTYENKGLIVKMKKSFENQDNEEDIGRSFYFFFYSDSKTTRFFKQVFNENVFQKLVAQRKT